MSADPSDDGMAPYLVALIFFVLATYLTFGVLPDVGSIPMIVGLVLVDLVLLVGGAIVAIPSLREPVLRLLPGTRIKHGPDGTEFTLGGAPAKPHEAPQPQERRPEVEPQERSDAKRLPRGEALAPEPEDILKTAYIHVTDDSEEGLDRACATLRAGLQRFPDEPQLLVALGYVYQNLNRLDEAIATTERAHAVLSARAQRTAEEEEKLWVAASNLCYQLALRAHRNDRNRALTLGAQASGRAKRFVDRDSFEINYGFAQLVFAETEEERMAALVYLARLLQRPLSREEQIEVLTYIAQGAKRLLPPRPEDRQTSQPGHGFGAAQKDDDGGGSKRNARRE